MILVMKFLSVTHRLFAISTRLWRLGLRSWFWCIFGLHKSPVFIHNTLFTCRSFAITWHDSPCPGWAQVAAEEAQAKADGVELP